MAKSGGSLAPAIMRDSIRNRGVAFSDDDRQKLNLVGRLPVGHLSLDEQAARTYAQMRQMPDALHKNIFLEALHDRNETLYYKILSEHLTELLPVVYDPTVGEAIRRYSDEYRGARGVYLTIAGQHHRGRAGRDVEDRVSRRGVVTGTDPPSNTHSPRR